ncbi:hypothetical protein AAFF_G00200080 [Aldrovandia affinis]|uniref:G-protein coupled receptors family 1 profile domain-containing protein n=1 Tax=Aldrovandia affinis TaxID=143900 RepID=A0AAD7RI49_9TELE|nr:hypothetical protein AAFF_G00200080 [Aldrovandia affinis]
MKGLDCYGGASGGTEFQVRFLPPVFGVEFCVALLGNVAALWLLATRERSNWHTGVVFSCNLALSDLLYSLTLPLLVFYYANDKHWPFGTAACKAERFLFTCNLYGSVFFVACISVTRYVAIVHPFFARSHVRPKLAARVGLLVWVVVAVISAPVLRFAGTCQGNGTTCGSGANASSSSSSSSSMECVSYCGRADERSHFAYSVFLAAFGCLLPSLATLASYAALIRVVWRNANITALEKRKVAIMVGVVVALYAVSFVPYHVLRNYYLYLKKKDQGMDHPEVYKAYQVTKGLVTLNMCLHPLLYMALIDSVRTLCCRGGERGGGGGG